MIPKPTQLVIKEIFVKKSRWHQWKDVFEKLKPDSDMIKWLNQVDGAPSNKNVWGFDQNDKEYTFENLKAWMDNDGHLDNAKGKAKDTDNSKKKKKKKKETQA
jgi:hypothetical protein